MASDNKNILEDFESIRKNNPFKVPEGYFETLPDRIQKRINESSKPRQSVVIRLMPWIAIAAVFIIGIIIVEISVLHQPKDDMVLASVVMLPENDVEMSELSDIELMEYIANDENIDIRQVESDLTLGLNADELESLVLF